MSEIEEKRGPGRPPKHNLSFDMELMATADGRQKLVVQITELVLVGKLTVYQAQAAQKLIKEYRDNLELQQMEAEVIAMHELMMEIIRRKSGLTKEDIIEICNYLLQNIRVKKETDGD